MEDANSVVIPHETSQVADTVPAEEIGDGCELDENESDVAASSEPKVEHKKEKQGEDFVPETGHDNTPADCDETAQNSMESVENGTGIDSVIDDAHNTLSQQDSMNSDTKTETEIMPNPDSSVKDETFSVNLSPSTENPDIAMVDSMDKTDEIIESLPESDRQSNAIVQSGATEAMHIKSETEDNANQSNSSPDLKPETLTVPSVESAETLTEDNTNQSNFSPDHKPETLTALSVESAETTTEDNADQSNSSPDLNPETLTALSVESAETTSVDSAPTAKADVEGKKDATPMDKGDKETLQPESSPPTQVAPEASIAQYSPRAKEADARIRKNKCVTVFIKTRYIALLVASNFNNLLLITRAYIECLSACTGTTQRRGRICSAKSSDQR